MITPIGLNAFQDNYIWILTSGRGSIIVVDPGEAKPVLNYLKEHPLTLEAILITHHHFDHCAGVEELLAHAKVPVYGGQHEPISTLSHPLKEGDLLNFSEVEFKILDIPGHTLGHIAYVGDKMLFCGDTLFTGGCGRLFEGSPEQMLHSLQKLKALPKNTEVYCGHEYTVSNLQFALAVEPENIDIQTRLAAAIQTRSQGLPTVPATLEVELNTNPFLRTDNAAVKKAVQTHVNNESNKELKTEVEIFAALRHWKNNFSLR